MNYLSFAHRGKSDSGKTDRWTVLNNSTTEILGWVEWKASWRKYWFVSLNGIGFDSNCLAEIAQFLADETRKHKEA